MNCARLAYLLDAAKLDRRWQSNAPDALVDG
jgi:hypothetical protein